MEERRFWASSFVEGTTEVQRKRARYARQACDECRRRKLKCCETEPCGRCVARSTICVYSSSDQDQDQEQNAHGQKRRVSCADRDRDRQQIESTEGPNTPEGDGVESLLNFLSSTIGDTALTNSDDAEYSWPTGPRQDDIRQNDVYHRTYRSSRSVRSPSPSSGDNNNSMSAMSSTPPTEQGDQVTDTFEMSINSNICNGKLSIQSKLSAAHNALGVEVLSSDASLVQKLSSSPTDAIHMHSRSLRTLLLPEPSRLVGFLQVFWAQHNPFFPCNNRGQFQQDLLQWLPAVGYGPGRTVVRVTPTFTPLASNLCMMLAVAEFVDPERGSRMSDPPVDQSIPGKLWHDKSLTILDRFSPACDQEVEIVRFHVLEAMYLIYTEQLRQASKAIAVAVQLAVRAGLHDQSSWTDLTPTMADSRRILFWSLYYLDRRISEKCGQPYLLRNEEVYVAEIVTPTVHGHLLPINGDGESVAFNTAMGHYVQHLIDWGHLWTDIWDTLFSLRVRKFVGDVSYVKSTNGQIERMLANLPPELQWRPERLKSGTGIEDERQARLPLLAYSRLVTVQLLLHHNPLSRLRSNITSSLGFRLTKATELVQAIFIYMETFNTYNQLGQWACGVLVDCIYHLAPFIATDNDETNRRTAITSLLSIKTLIENMSMTQGSARRAQRSLQRIFSAAQSCDLSPPNMGDHSSLQHSDSDAHLQMSGGTSTGIVGAGSFEASTSTASTHFSTSDFLSQLDLRSANKWDGLDMMLWPSSFDTFDQTSQISDPYYFSM